MNTTTATTITAYDVKSLVATAAGRWGYAAKRIESDLPGVSYLQLTMRTTVGQARIEVYNDAQAWGAASVIIGGCGHLITPTAEMRQAFTDQGCVSIFG